MVTLIGGPVLLTVLLGVLVALGGFAVGFVAAFVSEVRR